MLMATRNHCRCSLPCGDAVFLSACEGLMVSPCSPDLRFTVKRARRGMVATVRRLQSCGSRPAWTPASACLPFPDGPKLSLSKHGGGCPYAKLRRLGILSCGTHRCSARQGRQPDGPGDGMAYALSASGHDCPPLRLRPCRPGGGRAG